MSEKLSFGRYGIELGDIQVWSYVDHHDPENEHPELDEWGRLNESVIEITLESAAKILLYGDQIGDAHEILETYLLSHKAALPGGRFKLLSALRTNWRHNSDTV